MLSSLLFYQFRYVVLQGGGCLMHPDTDCLSCWQWSNFWEIL